MKIGRFEIAGHCFHGEQRGEEILPLEGELGSLVPRPGARAVSIHCVRALAPVQPSKIIAIGPGHNNMLAGRQPPDRPFLFLKPATTVINPGDPIVYPDNVSNILYEMELAIVIGRRASRVSRAQAGDHILGYTCCNDVTAGELARDWGTQFSYHWKSFDTFGPLGPLISTERDVEGLTMTSWINGEVQAETTVSLIYSPDDLVSWISHIMTLNPGDVIATGAAAQKDLRIGDLCEIEIEGIGRLSNPVVGI